MNDTSAPRRVAIIQARVSSSRLPGKVLLPLEGRPAIVFMVQRVRRARRLDAVWVATSTEPSDDPLAALCEAEGIDCYRGDLHDVLDRFYRAAEAAGAGHVVRLTGDCPLMDADLIDRALEGLARGDADYVSNTAPPTYPDGLDVEAFTIEALRRAWAEATLPSQREHVTPYLRADGTGYRRENFQGVADLSALRWTIDHADDLAHVRALLAAVGASQTQEFDRFDVYRAIEARGLRPGADHQRNEGYAKSLQADPGPAQS